MEKVKAKWQGPKGVRADIAVEIYAPEIRDSFKAREGYCNPQQKPTAYDIFLHIIKFGLYFIGSELLQISR